MIFFKWLHLISPHSTSAALYLLITSLWTRIQQICQWTNSRSNICLISFGEHLALLYLASRHFYILYPSKTETGPGFVSFPSYAHADANSCFELPPPLCSVFYSAGSGLSLSIQGADSARDVCLNTFDRLGVGGGHHSTSAHFSISVGEWWRNQFFFLNYCFSSDWMTSLQTSSYSLLYSESQVGFFVWFGVFFLPLDPNQVNLVTPGDPWPCWFTEHIHLSSPDRWESN